MKKTRIGSFICGCMFMLACLIGAGCKSGEAEKPAEGTTYTVSFETYGGTVIKDKTYTVGKIFNMPQNPTRYGYDFKGWYLDEAFTKPFTSAADDISANITLYAKFEKGVYSVNFTTGTSQKIDALSFSVGDTITLPTPDPRIVAGKEYAFSYWYNEQSGMPAEALEFKAEIPGDMYFKAVYDTGLTGAFDLQDDGSYVSLNVKSATLLKDMEAAYGTYEVNVTYTDLAATGTGLILKAQLDYNGAAFETANDSYVYIHSNPSVGAFQIATWDGTSYNALASVLLANNTTQFKAKYEALKNGADGASNVFAYKVVYTPEKISLFVDGELQVEANTAGKTIPGGLGVGFRATNKGMIFDSPVVTPSHYKIAYDTDGGNVIGADYVEIGKKLSALPEPEKTGFDFVKWQLNGEDFTADDSISGNITLKAVYEQKPGGAIISFDSAGGSTHESVYVESNAAIGVLPVPTKIGYEFTGWTYGNNETVDESTVFNTESDEPKHITLKANWIMAGTDRLTNVTSILGKSFTVTATPDDYTKIASAANAIGSVGTLEEGRFSVIMDFADTGANGLMFGGKFAADFSTTNSGMMPAETDETTFYYYWHFNNLTGGWQLVKLYKGEWITLNKESSFKACYGEAYVKGAAYKLTVVLTEMDEDVNIVLYVNDKLFYTACDKGGALKKGDLTGFRTSNTGAVFYGAEITPLSAMERVTLTFNVNGGAAIEEREVLKGIPVVALPMPEKENDEFVTWYYVSEGENVAVTPETAFMQSATVYASYESDSTVENVYATASTIGNVISVSDSQYLGLYKNVSVENGRIYGKLTLSSSVASGAATRAGFIFCADVNAEDYETSTPSALRPANSTFYYLLIRSDGLGQIAAISNQGIKTVSTGADAQFTSADRNIRTLLGISQAEWAKGVQLDICIEISHVPEGTHIKLTINEVVISEFTDTVYKYSGTQVGFMRTTGTGDIAFSEFSYETTKDNTQS